MENHFDLTNDEFEKQFKACTMAPSLFTHEDHLRLAYIHIQNYGVNKAIDTICQQLKAYVSLLGEYDKYNTTLTIAAIKAVHHFMRKSTSNDFKGFISEYPQLKYGFKKLMQCHYGFDIFNSQKAKTNFLEPDLIPFD